MIGTLTGLQVSSHAAHSTLDVQALGEHVLDRATFSHDSELLLCVVCCVC